ncbi:MAG TPA: hypothetical protein VNE71_10220 [Myxococcota bacterium]|jgi:hypothetical protein|nr:hypothetical protein [Myxococcota bacterium]
MSKNTRVSALVRSGLRCALLALVVAAPAAATPVVSIQIGPGDMQNNWNVPKLTFENLSTAGETIAAISITVGAPGYVYDFVAGLASNPAGQPANVATETATGATLVAGDRVNGTGSVTTLVWSFGHFSPGERLVFEVDLDRADGTQTVDARSIWFNNGGAPNASVVVTFTNGATATIAMPDTSGPPSSLSFGPTIAVPEPATASLLAAGIIGLYLVGARFAVRARQSAASRSS